jgi:hypothetical protein
MSSAADTSADQETADLILRLQLEVAGVCPESFTGKSRDPTDTQLAFELQREQLETVSQYLSDKRMAHSIAAAVQADEQIITQEIQGRERGSTRSRTMSPRPLGNDARTRLRERLDAIPVDASYWQSDYYDHDEPESSA